ncbi:MAG: hypothetical protein M3347_03620 [Armatimonadota bacterium]|nr:hypothetical protein [Armatimonadota bacterium]
MTPEPALLYTPSRPFRRVTLEISLKPFFDTLPATRVRVAEHLFRQWMPLCHRADSISVMFWASDGSEILDYRGDLDATFEWAYWLGSANPWKISAPTEPEGPDEQGVGFHVREADAEQRGLHQRAYLYRENPPQFTYRWLKDLIVDLKRIGLALAGKPVEVGLTFDPGPEFAVSDFKYRLHPELCQAGLLWGKTFVPCTARLHADKIAYAAFPDGIAEGTSIGTFLGRQLARLQADLPFDFIWFSNGFGFGSETWSCRGELFDGQQFSPEKATAQKEAILEFWRDFRRECPTIPVRTRGTNLTTGVDVASDGVPLHRIYREVAGLEAPVNSPWAALDGDFGLELTGWMSHIAELPNEQFTYRFYAHDPWWMNSPYFDRYERRAHDIFLPLGVARLDDAGAIQPPDNLSILSVDNSHGQMPDTFAAEISAHLLRTRELSPDAIGPLLWVYPFEEYHAAVFDQFDPQAVYFGDWFVRGMINNGLPLNTVASSTNFIRHFEADPRRFAETVLVAPVPAPHTALRQALLRHAQNGGKLLLYGPIRPDDEELLNLLGLEIAPGWEGDLQLGLTDRTRAFFSEEPVPERIHHPSIFSAGSLRHAFCRSDSDEISQLAWAEKDGEQRSLGVVVEPAAWNGGALCWLRGSLSCDETRRTGLLPAPLNKAEYFSSEALARVALNHLGITIRVTRGEAGDRVPMLTIARSRNAWVLAAYNPDDARLTLRLPYGAPVPLGHHIPVAGGLSQFTPPAAWLAECRVFVEQEEASTLYVQEVPSIMAGVRRRWLVKGLRHATLRFFPEDDGAVEFLCEPVFPYLRGDFREARPVQTPSGLYFELVNLNGSLLISR